MPTSAVPTVTFTATGFQAPAESEILTGVQADQNAAFGGNLNLALNTPQGQLASSQTAILGQVDTDFVTLAQLMDPAYSYGRFQDAIGRIVPGQGFARNPAQPTVVTATCSGAAGVNIPVGQLVGAADGNLYVCTEAGTIPVGGSISLTFQCTVAGPIACPAGNLGPTPYSQLPGLDSIINASPGTVGNNVETRAAFEFRRTGAVAANSGGQLQSIRGAVLNVANVLDCYTSENTTSAAIVIGATASVTGSVSGTNLTVSAIISGTAIVVGQLVTGAGVTAGTVIVSQTSGTVGLAGVYVLSNSMTVSSETLTTGGFQLAANSLYVAVTGGASADVAAAIWTKKDPGCGYNGNTSVTVYDTAPPYTAPYPSYSVTYEIPNSLPCAFNVVISNSSLVPSTALAQIQTAIINAFYGEDGGPRARIGSEIYASRFYAAVASLGPWAAIIDIQICTPNLPDASFTAAISGLTMTVGSTQQGTIAIGQAVFGTGVAAGTYIVSGTGPYTLNTSQTVSSRKMTGVFVNDNIVQVQINQSPTLDPSNIVLTLV